MPPHPDAPATLATTTAAEPRPLPDGWRWARLGDVCVSIEYGYTASATLQGQGPRFLRITDIRTGSIDWNSVPVCVMSEQEEGRYLLSDGDIVVARTGSVGNSCLLQSPPRAVFASYLLRLRLSDEVQPEFVNLFFQSDHYWSQIRDKARGGIQQNVNASMLASLLIPLPPLAEQRRIAAILAARMAAVERARAAAQAQVEAARALPAAELRAIFESEEAQAWPRVRLATILSDGSLNGLAPRPSDTPPGYPILRISAGTSRADGRVDETDYKYLDVDELTLARYRLVPGDLLACRFNGNLHNVGKFSLYTGSSGLAQVYPDKLIRFRVRKTEASPEFVVLAMNSYRVRERVEAICDTTAGNIGVNATELKDVELPLPSLRDQLALTTHYARRMVEIARLRESLMAQLDTINALPAALLRQAFNGEL